MLIIYLKPLSADVDDGHHTLPWRKNDRSVKSSVGDRTIAGSGEYEAEGETAGKKRKSHIARGSCTSFCSSHYKDR